MTKILNESTVAKSSSMTASESSMIPEKVEFEFEGCPYLWEFDSNIGRVSKCWNWSEVKTSKTPPDSKIGNLNRKFITEKAERIAEALTAEPQAAVCKRFYEILRSMGTGENDFETPALQHILAFSAHSPGQRSLPRGLPPRSPLTLLGYRVGKDCPVCVTRQPILSRAFREELPLVELPPDELDAYMRKWGDPGSEKRLEKIATHIANSCFTFKRSLRLKEAIADWESDLLWLKENIYDKESFTFDWPRTSV